MNPLAGYNQVLIKSDNQGNDTYYVYGLGLISQETNDVSSYYHFDFRGSTVAVTTPMETVLDTFEYDSYGNVLTRTGTSDIIFEYNGKYGVVTDDDGLVFMMTRYYNKGIKRFINRDSLYGSISKILSTNQHLFAYGNPSYYIDPTCMKPPENYGLDEDYNQGKGTRWQKRIISKVRQKMASDFNILLIKLEIQ